MRRRRFALASIFLDSSEGVNTRNTLQNSLSKSSLLPKILLPSQMGDTNDEEATLHQRTASAIKCKSFAESRKNSINKKTNSSIHPKTNFDDNSPSDESNNNKTRSHSNVYEHQFPFNFSDKSLTSSQVSLKSTSEDKKKVIHLNISQYIPRKLSARDRAEICRKLNQDFSQAIK